MVVFALQMGDGCELDVQSAAAFAQRNEELSYWQLQVWPVCYYAYLLMHIRVSCACVYVWLCVQACHLAFCAVQIITAMQARAQSLGRILFGFYAVPDSSSVPIDFVINLEGNAARSTKRYSAMRRSHMLQGLMPLECARKMRLMHAARAIHAAEQIGQSSTAASAQHCAAQDMERR